MDAFIGSVRMHCSDDKNDISLDSGFSECSLQGIPKEQSRKHIRFRVAIERLTLDAFFTVQ